MAVCRFEYFSEILQKSETVNLVGNLNNNNYRAVFICLHALGGNQNDFLYKSTIEVYAKKYNLLIILPNGARSFYLNMINGYQYYDYINEEIEKICSNLLNINLKKKPIYLLGISMGGYGALNIGLDNLNKYTGFASISGSLDIVKRDAIKRLGEDFIKKEWQNIIGNELNPRLDLFKKINNQVKNKIFISCGKNDYLYKYNQKFVECLKKNHCNYCYRVDSNAHDWFAFNNQILPAIKFLIGEK